MYTPGADYGWANSSLSVRAALHDAAKRGSLESVRMLMAQNDGAMVRELLCDPSGGHYVLSTAAEAGQLDVVKWLLEAGAAVNAQDPGDKSTALHLAAYMSRIAVVEHLLDCGADPDLVDAEHSTPLHDAARRGHANVVRMLLERGASRTIENGQKETAEMVARKANQQAVLAVFGNERQAVRSTGSTPALSPRETTPGLGTSPPSLSPPTRAVGGGAGAGAPAPPRALSPTTNAPEPRTFSPGRGQISGAVSPPRGSLSRAVSPPSLGRRPTASSVPVAATPPAPPAPAQAPHSPPPVMVAALTAAPPLMELPPRPRVLPPPPVIRAQADTPAAPIPAVAAPTIAERRPSFTRPIRIPQAPAPTEDAPPAYHTLVEEQRATEAAAAATEALQRMTAERDALLIARDQAFAARDAATALLTAERQHAARLTVERDQAQEMIATLQATVRRLEAEVARRESPEEVALRTLAGMGFVDRERCVALLRAHNNDVDRVVEAFFS